MDLGNSNMIGRGKSSEISTILIGCYASSIILGEPLKNAGNQLSSGLVISSSQVSQGLTQLQTYSP